MRHTCWWARPDSNWQHPAFQAGALRDWSYRPVFLVATVGIEPTTFALSRRYSTTELRGYGMVPSEGVEPSSSRFVGATPVPLDQVLKYFADRPGIEPGSFSVNSGAPTPCLLAVSKVLLVLRRRRDSNPYHPLNRRITIH